MIDLLFGAGEHILFALTDSPDHFIYLLLSVHYIFVVASHLLEQVNLLAISLLHLSSLRCQILDVALALLLEPLFLKYVVVQ